MQFSLDAYIQDHAKIRLQPIPWFSRSHVAGILSTMGQGASFCERRRGSCPPLTLAHVDLADTRAATHSSLGSTVHSTLAHSKFEQSVCQVLHDHGLDVTSNVYYSYPDDENFQMLEDTTAFHNAKNFVLQVHLQGLKHVPEVKEWVGDSQARAWRTLPKV